jgi:hypothetical protein
MVVCGADGAGRDAWCGTAKTGCSLSYRTGCRKVAVGNDKCAVGKPTPPAGVDPKQKGRRIVPTSQRAQCKEWRPTDVVRIKDSVGDSGGVQVDVGGRHGDGVVVDGITAPVDLVADFRPQFPATMSEQKNLSVGNVVGLLAEGILDLGGERGPIENGKEIEPVAPSAHGLRPTGGST